MHFQKYKTYSIIILICIALISTSCGGTAQSESEISTAVAQTVQAQDALTKVSKIPTLTPIPPVEITSTPEISPTATTAAITNPGCTVAASLIGENPPDGTILTPGENFWKTWSLQNTGTCTWDSSYSLVYWSGDLMGGLTSYPFPEVVAPNETKDISIYLKAPETEGEATGYWRIRTPWGADFGVGPKSVSFYVKVNVSQKPKYGISNVSYELVRDPLVGCPVNVRFIVYATITTNGPYKFSYYWDQSDGNESAVKTLEFTEAGSRTLKRDWLIGRNDSPNPRWIKFIVTAPKYQDYGKVDIIKDCN